MACKSLPNDRYSLDYEGKSLGIFYSQGIRMPE